ncbi:hypothetical protein BIFLAC_06231 [Bifidobacterium animalis subsp. lactis HN019]|nr:hypothetical protein BIFLAC_06231 [Bifidobacterium animalis subsp. lactis HN019]
MFGGALNLNEFAGSGHCDVHVGHCAAVFDVRQVEHRFAVDHAHRHGGDAVEQHVLHAFDLAVLLRPVEGVHEGHVRSGDRRGARAAVGLEHVAIHLDRVLAERLHVNHAAQASADESGDLMGAAAHLAANRFTVGALCGGARQHRILRSDPTEPGVLAPARHGVGERGGAHHARVAAFNEHGSFRHVGECAGDAHGSQLIVCTAVCSGNSHGNPLVVLSHHRPRGNIGRMRTNVFNRHLPPPGASAPHSCKPLQP